MAFFLPLAASAQQLAVIWRGDVYGNIKTLSFSVLAVFLHMLFELRVFESVCKFVTIIQQAVTEIRVFFVIFAGGVLAFAIATLHLVHGCAYDGCAHPETDFPFNFLKVVSSVYFFMGGVWDPVSEGIKSDNFGLHVMMALFFFTSVVLMLNVLIALINVAFTKGDDGWRLAWIESRLRYIEAAENMSYHIPGFRQTYDFFPDEIYFSVTHKQLQEMQRKFDGRNWVIMDLDMTENHLKEDGENDALEANDALEENDGDSALEGKRNKRKHSMDRDSTNDGSVADSVKQGAVEDVLEAQVKDLMVVDSDKLGSKIDSRQGEEGSVPATEGAPPIQQRNRDREWIHRLRMQVEDLHQQVANLRKDLSDGLSMQQEYAER